MSKPKKPFKETKIGKFIHEKVKPVAGDVLQVVGDLTGIEAVEKVGEFINGRRENDAQMQALWVEFEKQKLEMELELTRIDLDFFKAEVQDRDSARNREVEFMKASGGKRDWLMGAVICTGLALLIGVVVVLVFIQIPEQNQRLADMCFGTIMGIGTSIFAYYVGTSRSSRAKDETIKNALK